VNNTSLDAVAVVEPKAVQTGKNGCKYARKGAKEECDPVTKTRTITLTLKKKNPSSCEPTRTIIKECNVKGTLRSVEMH